MTVALKPCPICQGEVKYHVGYYFEGNWRWPHISCQTQHCGLTYRPVIYPDKGEIFVNWNNRNATQEFAA